MPLFEGSLSGVYACGGSVAELNLRQSELYSGQLGFHVQFVHVWNVFLELKIVDG